MTEPVQFAFSKNRLIVLGLCFALICMLLFGAGLAAGFLLSKRQNQKGQVGAQFVNSQTPKALAKLSEDAPATKPPQAPPTTETATTLSEGSGPGLHEELAVELSGFRQEAAAKRLATLLTKEGYGTAETGSYLAQGQVLYFIRLGPYREWESASRVAGELRRSFDLRPSLLPIRASS